MCVCDIIDPRKQRVPFNSKLASDCTGACTQTHQVKNRLQIPGVDCSIAKSRVKPGEINLTLVKSCARGQVEEIFENHGNISYTLDQQLWESTVLRNGAPSLPNNNGKIFFYRSEVFGGIASLKVGQTVEFDLVHLKSNNKIIAHRIYFVQESKFTSETLNPVAILNSLHMTESEYAGQLAHFQNMSLPKIVDQIPQKPKVSYEQREVTGKIEELFDNVKLDSNQRYANLVSNRYPGEKLFMHVSSLIKVNFSDLRVGDICRFSVWRNNHNKTLLARNCERVQASKIQDHPSCAQAALSHFQFMEPTRFTDDIVAAPFTKIANNIQGVIRRLVEPQNCGFLTFANKNSSSAGKAQEARIFFHAKDLFKLRFGELTEGQKVAFNLYQNSKNQKYVAKEVTKGVVSIPELTIAKDILATSSLSSAARKIRPAAQKIMPKPVNNLLMDNKEKWEARRRSVETLNLQSKSNSGTR